MFDLRYHLASLAAVFIAIAVGIVIGVAIASGGSLEEATRSLQKSLQEQRIKSLEADLEAAQADVERSEGQQRAIAEVMGDVYPTLMANRLAGRRVALLFVGPIDGTVRSAVERVLTDAGSSGTPLVTALALPIDVPAIDGLLESDPLLPSYVGDAQLGDLGAALSRELAAGGETPLWDLLANQIVEEWPGAFAEPVDGVIVARSWWPETPSDPAFEQRDRQTEALITGLLDELGRLSIPAVGVEASTSQPSGIGLYRESGISSVDNVDTLPGRLVLALLLGGAESGHYGVKDSADAVLPPLLPVAPEPVETVAG